MRKAVATLMALTLLAVTPGARRQTGDLQTERLATLGRVWVAVKFAHPRVALTDRDWDAVLSTAVPAVKAATDARSFEAAIAAMLATLDDPATRVVSGDGDTASPSVSAPPKRPLFTTLPGGGLLVDVRVPDASHLAILRDAIAGNSAIVANAERIVVDLRGSESSAYFAELLFESLNEVLASRPIMLPAARYVRHSGYKPQSGGATFYTSDVVTEAATAVKPREGMRPRPVAFVIDRSAFIPPIAVALRAEGAAAILSVGEPPAPAARTMSIPLGASSRAIIRVADLSLGGRRLELEVDETLKASEPDERIHSRALELAARERKPIIGIEESPPAWQPDRAYADVPFPSEIHRLLAVYRLWGVIDNFFPYKHLLDRSWDEALTQAIPRVLAASNELEYARAIAELASRTQDSHVRVSGSRALTAYLGEVGPPVFVRYIEDRPVITRIFGDTAVPGLAVGDEIVSVDGDPVEARAHKIEQCFAYSTPASRNGIIASRLLGGAPGSDTRITVRGADGELRNVELKRPAKPTFGPQRTGEIFRILDGDIGYVDLERLEVSQVGAMFEQFRSSAGIIFDMRGYPRGTAWAIAPRINTNKATAAALFFRPIVAAGSTFERLSFMQDLPPTTTWVYERPTVMLIDERTISQAEHSGLFYKASNGTTFIGSPTTGANGDVTSMVLPGGLRVSFTGHDVRWPDGRQLQRVGLIPDVPVKPTIAGVRGGRDEVLEAAVAYLRKPKT